MAKRKYNDSYLDYGFTFVERRDEQLPQYVVCHKTLFNASMKPHQLKQQLCCKGQGLLRAQRKLIKENEIGQYRTISNRFKGDSDCTLQSFPASG